MRRPRQTITGLLAIGLLAATGCSASSGQAVPGTPGGDAADVTGVVQDGAECSAARAVPLEVALSNGATWALCLDVHEKLGMVLRDLSFTPPGGTAVRVADQVALSQLEVPYDTGERTTRDITHTGFGGLKMQTLTETECAGELVDVRVPDIGDGEFGNTSERAVLCSDVADAGLAFRSEEGGTVHAGRHDAWTLSTVSKVGWYEYVVSYTLGADGSLLPQLGATGDLSPVDFATDPAHGSPVGSGTAGRAASHAHNAVWRIDWALGGGPLRVEQYDAAPTGAWGSESPRLDGGLRPISHPAARRRADRRWWRVVAPGLRNTDGHPASYEISLGATDSFAFSRDLERHGADAGYDVAFTNADECQLFASENGDGCGDGVLDFIADGRDQPLTDVVSWVAVGFHHVPRDEDQSPMQVHWQGFRLTPRDLTAQRVDVPEGRADLNGQPEEWNGERVEELVARDLAP